MPIYSRADATKFVSPSFTPTANLLKMFSDVIPMGTVLYRRSFYQNYLPKYEKKRIIVNGLVFSIRPAWTDYKADPGSHIIIIGHVVLCHMFDCSIIYQPSTRLFTENTTQRLRQFKALLDRVNQNKYTTPSLVKKKVTA